MRVRLTFKRAISGGRSSASCFNKRGITSSLFFTRLVFVAFIRLFLLPLSAVPVAFHGLFCGLRLVELYTPTNYFSVL